MRGSKPPQKPQVETVKQAKFLRGLQEDYPGQVGLFRGVFTAKTSRAKAVKAMCLACCYFDKDGIAYCSASECPLWRWRPYEKKSTQAQVQTEPGIEVKG